MITRNAHDDEVLITSVLKRVADDSPRRRNLPEAHYLWLTAQLIPNRVMQDRALKSIGVLQVLAHAVVAICWAFVITWKWSSIKEWFGAPALGARLMDLIAGAGSVPFSFVVLVGGLLCITTVVILHSAFAEE